MQRTVPRTSTDTINLFMRTYYSLLRTTDVIPIQSLIESYLMMESSLHTFAHEDAVDVSTLVYSGLRLPGCITQVEMVLMGQTEDVFEDHGYPVDQWERVSAPGRRRRMHWDGGSSLGVFISSRSDIDDLLPMITSYQIEWNKIHDRMRQTPAVDWLQNAETLNDASEEDIKALASIFGVKRKEIMRLGVALGPSFITMLRAINDHRKHFRLRLLAGSQADYRKATSRWWANLRETSRPHGYDLEEAPIYFISSNLHSALNVLSGFAVRERDKILQFLNEAGQHDLLQEYHNIQSDELLASNEPNFLYYSMKKYMARHPHVRQLQQEAEAEIGSLEIPSIRGFDVGAQVFPLNKLKGDYLDPRLAVLEDFSIMEKSNALIVNIDYPLGVSAYELLSHVAARVGRLLGIYIMGKAATLNGRIGDVMVPNVVHDEHSNNTYLFANCFNARHIVPYITVGSVLDNQKAVTSYGTFLQNPAYMDVFYQEGYTIIEMEAGPYLSAVYESVRPRRHPTDEVVRLYEASLDVGILHYASDTPFSKGHNLGAGSLGYAGIEPTYAATIAILRRIFEVEEKRLKEMQKEKPVLLPVGTNGATN